ncbi:hypothetical protein [Natrinema salaciae]|uniref:hypothetical protein n=1 Tax=Natrinema salaciae TaxID=1186196 RepID=UPI001C314479|nr:hypothetical protein [Natrinema salaciae]
MTIVNTDKEKIHVKVTVRADEREPVTEIVTLGSSEREWEKESNPLPPYQEYLSGDWVEEANMYEVSAEINGIDRRFSTNIDETKESDYIGLHGHIHPKGGSLMWSIEYIDPEEVSEYRKKVNRFTNSSVAQNTTTNP